jgi:hypothetical protein
VAAGLHRADFTVHKAGSGGCYIGVVGADFNPSLGAASFESEERWMFHTRGGRLSHGKANTEWAGWARRPRQTPATAARLLESTSSSLVGAPAVGQAIRAQQEAEMEKMNDVHSGDVVGLLFDADQGTLGMYLNGQWLGLIVKNLPKRLRFAVEVGFQDCVQVKVRSVRRAAAKPKPSRGLEATACAGLQADAAAFVPRALSLAAASAAGQAPPKHS